MGARVDSEPHIGYTYGVGLSWWESWWGRGVVIEEPPDVWCPAVPHYFRTVLEELSNISVNITASLSLSKLASKVKVHLAPFAAPLEGEGNININSPAA